MLEAGGWKALDKAKVTETSLRDQVRILKERLHRREVDAQKFQTTIQSLNSQVESLAREANAANIRARDAVREYIANTGG